MNDQHTDIIPTTREEALEAVVNQDCQRWGEGEREASRRQYSKDTYGSLLNTLYARADLDGAPQAKALKAAARKALTPADWAERREGG